LSSMSMPSGLTATLWEDLSEQEQRGHSPA
jgi:hypothetical protein